MKYIIFELFKGVPQVPVLFPEFVDHNVIGDEHGGEENVAAAGKFNIRSDSNGDLIVDVYGSSIAYPNKPPRQAEDEYFILAMLRRG